MGGWRMASVMYDTSTDDIFYILRTKIDYFKCVHQLKVMCVPFRWPQDCPAISSSVLAPTRCGCPKLIREGRNMWKTRPGIKGSIQMRIYSFWASGPAITYRYLQVAGIQTVAGTFPPRDISALESHFEVSKASILFPTPKTGNTLTSTPISSHHSQSPRPLIDLLYPSWLLLPSLFPSWTTPSLMITPSLPSWYQRLAASCREAIPSSSCPKSLPFLSRCCSVCPSRSLTDLRVSLQRLSSVMQF